MVVLQTENAVEAVCPGSVQACEYATFFANMKAVNINSHIFINEGRGKRDKVNACWQSSVYNIRNSDEIVVCRSMRKTIKEIKY